MNDYNSSSAVSSRVTVSPIGKTTNSPHIYLTQPDILVLRNLVERRDDWGTIDLLQRLNDPGSTTFEPTILTSWDEKDAKWIRFVLEPFKTWAKSIVRRPTDVVFLTHILLYLFTSFPSALLLFWHFTWIHGVFHWLMQSWYCGSFTLMLHNHIHNNGVLAREYAWFDRLWPYILEPLMGHSWDSYFYHHVKHHHVENNGPGDLSSTIRYQRDSLPHFLCYVGRFLAFVWIELPLYFVRKRKFSLAIKTLVSEIAYYTTIALASKYSFRASLFTLILPIVQMRIGMMVGNWGQHALVDEVEPDSDFRSSITLIDVAVSISQHPMFWKQVLQVPMGQFSRIRIHPTWEATRDGESFISHPNLFQTRASVWT